MRTSAFYALAIGQLAAAHTTFQSFVINGEDKGQHFAIRTPSNGNNPIKDVTSTSMNCNGGTATSDQVEIAAGSKFTMQWHHNDPKTESGDSDEPIASSHKGPVMVYISDASANGEGAVWTKIYEDGLTGSTWGVDNFITNKGAITITLPNLKAGNYLIRPEIIALHEASTQGMAQFYNGCGQIKVTGSGSAALPSAGTDMTKAYSATEAGVMFNLYNNPTSYPIPGPDVWDGASSSDDTTPTSTTVAASSAAAVVPSEAATSSKAAATSAAAAAAATSVVASKPAASSTAAGYPVASAKPAATSTVVAVVEPSATATAGSADLPEKFTIQEFISWLETKTGTAAARRFARSLNRKHARAFQL